MSGARRATSGPRRPAAGRAAANDEPEIRSGRLEGRVVDAEGQPVPGAQVLIASGPAHADIAMETGPGGCFDYGLLEAGRYLLTVYATGYQPRSADVRVVPGLRADTLLVLRRADRPRQRGPEPAPVPPSRRGAPGGGDQTPGGGWFAPEAPPDPEDEGWER